jgi:hypothetical protein
MWTLLRLTAELYSQPIQLLWATVITASVPEYENSVAITFDAKQNSVDNDPAYDHISIQANGDTRHRHW